MTKLNLSGPVGVGGMNNPQDIKNVQIALNQLLPIIAPTSRLKVDGSVGARPELSKTVAAIKKFQQKVVGMANPDGKIDPNKRTHQAINQKLSVVSLKNNSVSTIGNLKPKLIAALEKYEGRVNHMYLCTKGHVTIGVGILLPGPESAKKYGLIHREGGKAATTEDIKREYNTIKSKSFGSDHSARSFKKFTQLIMQNKDIDRVRDEKIVKFEIDLKSLYGFTEFNSFPAQVKLAVFDMIFNLGPRGVKEKFPNFNAAIRAFDWVTAASQCNRRNKGLETRNAYVKNLLLQAASDTNMIF